MLQFYSKNYHRIDLSLSLRRVSIAWA